MTYSLYIIEGTKVLTRKGIIELRGDAHVKGATRDHDGAFRYSIGKNEYICSAGCCEFKAEEAEKEPDWVRHPNALVWIG
jgi:hypothetical protein